MILMGYQNAYKKGIIFTLTNSIQTKQQVLGTAQTY